AKLVDAKEHQPDEDQEMPDLEATQMTWVTQVVEDTVQTCSTMWVVPRVEEKIRDPEVYAQLVLKQGLKVDESVVEHLFELLPDQRISRKTDECAYAGSPPKAWASGVYRHGGVLGVRNSTKDYPLATKVVNLFIQEKLGEHACWSTFSMHRNLNVKKHRDSHNARDKASYLIPISDFRDGGLWVQLKTGSQ
ncbi:unnamed protein product, partial [Symbiodinium microadriaticum]